MPLVRVTLYEEENITEEVAKDLIEKVTDAVCAATREGIRPYVWVLLDTVPARHWGVGGNPGSA